MLESTTTTNFTLNNMNHNTEFHTQFTTPNPRTAQKLSSFIEDIHTDPKIDTSIENSAQKLFICVRRLGQICREILGKSPAEVRKEAVLGKAQSLLKETDSTVAEVADQLGFQDSANFSTFFKKHTGYSPSEFRGWR